MNDIRGINLGYCVGESFPVTYLALGCILQSTVLVKKVMTPTQ
jgi:hypothetical protein